MSCCLHRLSENSATEKDSTLKILLLTEAAGSGVGRHVLDLAQGLAKNGHDIHVLYSENRVEDRFLQRIEELDGMIRTSVVPIERSVSLKNDLLSFIKIKKYVKRNGPFDIIHGHSSKAGALARLLKITGKHSARVIYTPHAFVTLSPNLSSKQRLTYRIIERGLGMLLTDAVVAVSNYEARHAVELGIPSQKVNVIANGIDADDDFAKKHSGYRDSIGVKEGDIVIGFSGRLDYQKAPEILVQAFLSIEDNSNLHLVILGDGPKRKELEKMIEDHPNSESIHFIGYHPFAPVVLNAMDIFVLPSRYESLPYVLLEAMAAGLPIITTSVGGNGELVRDGINGLLIHPDSVEELTDALIKLSSNPSIRKFFGRASFEIVSESFRAQQMIDNTIDLYNRLQGAG